MMHIKRRWGIAACEDADELAEKLTELTWTLCAAFRTKSGTVWANDSTSEDAIQEYGVLRPEAGGTWRQVETITVSWCDRAEIRSYIERADAGEFDGDTLGRASADRFDDAHQVCDLCR